ncbi:uncharacterized protein SCHCODRAFT_02554196 [Schizophyllum commune H4-8]|uniref:Uncharacterized protein n=1 Tax=Schizophyllum commune (strain H4-8 / FGSC 9210) TaxID=578458 RepID=D8QH18_SCHCM|nr:uncharacterized protein SCHCODRAFT_02554196 [Schizophyllum commune H4-8]KAI5886986.1 hypothetical protein SCHCODRAFT_02554196 [Schizophyllum commune H4-8]
MSPTSSPLSSLTSLSEDDAPTAPHLDTNSAPEGTHACPATSGLTNDPTCPDDEDLSEAQKRNRMKDRWVEEVSQLSTKCFGCKGAIRLSDVYESRKWYEIEKYCSHAALLEESGTLARSLSGAKGSIFEGDAARSNVRRESHGKARITTASAKAEKDNSIPEDPAAKDTRRQPSRSRPRRNVKSRKSSAHAPQQPAPAASTPDYRATAETEDSKTLFDGSDSEAPDNYKGSNEPIRRGLGDDSLEKPSIAPVARKVCVGKDSGTRDISKRRTGRRDEGDARSYGSEVDTQTQVGSVFPEDEDMAACAPPRRNHRGKVAHVRFQQNTPSRSNKDSDPREAKSAKTPVYGDIPLVDAFPAAFTHSDTLSAEFPKVAYSINGIDGLLDLPPLITYAESSMRSTLQDTPTDDAGGPCNGYDHGDTSKDITVEVQYRGVDDMVVRAVDS